MREQDHYADIKDLDEMMPEPSGAARGLIVAVLASVATCLAVWLLIGPP